MVWLERTENWLPQKEKKRVRPQKVERMYTVSEVADIFSVDRSTVFKWLSLDETESAVIPPDMWIKLPKSGHIRIRESIVKQLQEGMN